MIDFIIGRIHSCSDNTVSILTSSGMGYELSVTDSGSCSVGQDVHLFTHFHWNQEQGPQLFGFKDVVERQVFRVLIECNGIGPKLALSILQQLRPADLVAAVRRQDEQLLSSLNGIGKKKAEQILVALKHRIDKLGIVPASTGAVDTKQLTDVLASLNYSKQEIIAAVHAVNDYFGSKPEARFDEQMRVALSHLASYKSLSK